MQKQKQDFTLIKLNIISLFFYYSKEVLFRQQCKLKKKVKSKFTLRYLLLNHSHKTIVLHEKKLFLLK